MLLSQNVWKRQLIQNAATTYLTIADCGENVTLVNLFWPQVYFQAYLKILYLTSEALHGLGSATLKTAPPFK